MDGHSAGVGVARLDASGRCLYANERLAKIAGRRRESFLGLGWTSGMPPEIVARVRGEYWSELRAGRAVFSLDTWVRPDGRQVSYHFEWLPELDAEGQLRSVIVTCVDAAERREAEAESRRLEQQAASRLEEIEELYQRAPVGLCLVDRELRYLRANDLYAGAVGYRPDDLIGRSMAEVLPESAREEAVAQARRVIETGQPILDVELRGRNPRDPSQGRTWLANLHPVVRDGRVTGAMAVIHDISSVRRAARAAARRLEELEILYANTPVGLCQMDPELRVVHVNPIFAGLSERPLEEQVGALIEELLPDEIARQMLPQLRYVARTGTSSVDLELHGRLPGRDPREYRWISRTHALRSPDRELTGIITVLQDVTPLAERQREIETVRDRLAEAQHVAGVGSWDWDLLEDTVWWSPEMYEIFGEGPAYPPSYTGFFEHAHPSDREKVREQLEQTLANDRPYRMTFRIVRADGSERLLFTAARLERSAGGVAARLVGTCQDMTDFGPSGPRLRRRRGQRS